MPKIIETGKVKVEGDDSYSSIAHHLCGAAGRWPELLNANPKLRREPMSPAQVGMVLDIPKDWPIQTADQLAGSRPAAAPRAVSPRAGSAPAPAAASAPQVSREEYEKLGSVVRELAEWITKADEQIGEQGDKIAILEAQRDADQTRLAQQGAKIQELEHKLSAASAAPTSPAPAKPAETPQG